MKEKNKYVDIWQTYIGDIIDKIHLNSNSPIQISQFDFEKVGKRFKSGYSFNLELKKGDVINNINNSAVARDLKIVISNSEDIMKLINQDHYKINMDNKFYLFIKKLT